MCYLDLFMLRPLYNIKKGWPFLLIFLTVSSGVSLAQDTLRHYDPSAGSIAVFGSPFMLFARQQPDRPITLRSIRIHVEGSVGDSATLRLFGHEGGAQFPQRDPQLVFHSEYLVDFHDPIPIVKTTDGPEWIIANLTEPITFRNNQFFVCLDDIGGIKWTMSTQVEASSCTASLSQGGEMFRQLRGNKIAQTITGTNNPFLVDCIGEFQLSQTPFFENVADSVHGFVTSNSAASIAVADYNGDGQLDLLLRNKLYKNLGDFQFEEEPIGLGSAAANLFLDMDNDGDLDIISLDVADTSYLFEYNGTSFQRHVLNGIPALRSVHSFSAGDINGDNFPDLFISQLWGTYPVPYPNFLFLNNHSGDFVDETVRLYSGHDGVSNFPNRAACDPGNTSTWLSNGNRNKRSRGSRFVDYDLDGDLDLYVSNYFLEPDEFFENNGSGFFTDRSFDFKLDRNPTSGSNHGTGVDWADVNNDGFFDVVTPQFAHPGWTGLYGHRGTNIYLNEGSPDFTFSDKYQELGLEFEETHAGASFADMDNSGRVDLFIKTYYGCRYDDLYLQNDQGQFELHTYEFGLTENRTGTDAVWADMNNDGLLDLLTGSEAGFVLLRNKGEFAGSCMELDIIRTSGLRTGIGNRVVVHAGGQIISRDVHCGKGQKMQNPYRLHFGLGLSTKVDSIEIYEGNNRTSFTDLDINKLYKYEEGLGLSAMADLDGAGIGVGHEQRVELQSRASVFPNPTRGLVFVKSTRMIHSIRIFDMSGKLVNAYDQFQKRSDFVSVPLEGKKGFYLMLVQTDQSTDWFKIVKE